MSANPPSCSAAPGMPSEAIADALNHAARAMQRQFRSGGTEEEIEAGICHHLGPAFEAKERDIEWLRGFVSSSEAERYRRCAELSDRALSAEAKLAQAVEALAAVQPYLGAIVCYASTLDEHGGNRVARLVTSASAAARGEA